MAEPSLPDWLHHALAECEREDDALMDTLSKIWVGFSSGEQAELEQDARISKASAALQLRELASAEAERRGEHERARNCSRLSVIPHKTA